MDQDFLEVPYRSVAEYLFSLGGVSRFFQEVVDNQRIMGTRCAQCGKVYCPPRAHCCECYTDTEWVPLGNEGVVVSASLVTFAPRKDLVHKCVDLPYFLVTVRPDGCDGTLVNMVYVKDPVLGQVKPGMRVKAVFREKRDGHITDFYYVPIA